MMREILFRGKDIDTGKWAHGGYSIYPHTRFPARPTIYEVDHGCWHPVEIVPETLGQYTGMKDRNGKKIFEGDIVDCWSEGVNAKGTVQQRKDGMWIIYPSWQKLIMWSLCPDEHCNTTVKIIGNIHDNPELLKEKP